VFGEESSGFWFYGRIGPGFLVPPFSVSDVAVTDAVQLQIAWEGIGLWSPPGERQFKQPREANTLFGTVISAWALMSGTALTVTLEGWVEAHNAAVADSTMGWIINRPGAAAQASPQSEQSKLMREACELATKIYQRAPYRLAVRDVHSALSDREDDAFVYAYRALEDLARAVSGQEEQLTGADWQALHNRLGQDPEIAAKEIEPLRLARNAIGHGNPDHSDLREARQRRDDLLLDVRRRVLRALASDAELGVGDIAAKLPEGDPWAARD
jgi:hypothetical protein